MNGPPPGLTIVVTRPAAQAGPFIALAEAAGATCLALPALVIESLAPDAQTLADIRRRHWDWAIYTSANAVTAAHATLPAPVADRIAAVGAATARSLADHGHRAVVTPHERADSEGLLSVPELQDVRGRRVLILKGVGGREVLHDELASRGAHVRTLDLYRRLPAVGDRAVLAALHEVLAAAAPLAVAATSSEILEGLLRLVAEPDATRLRGAPLVVPGVRVAATAQRLSWRGRILVAASAEDHAMLAALGRLAESTAPGA